MTFVLQKKWGIVLYECFSTTFSYLDNITAAWHTQEEYVRMFNVSFQS